MKKYKIIIEDEKAEEFVALLKKLPYVKQVKERDTAVDAHSLTSEQSLSEDWEMEEGDELQKLYGK